MFTGIVLGLAFVKHVESQPGLKKITLALPALWTKHLQIGASLAVDGVCLTVVSFDAAHVTFDVIQETLEKTTLKTIKAGQQVNVERAAKFGDEIGGHVLSGHIYGEGSILEIKKSPNNTAIFFQGNAAWTKYLFPKGYVAIDGISLTLVDVLLPHVFSVHLIPETLDRTTLGFKKVGDLVNIEIDAQIQAIVDTIERINGRSALYDRPMGQATQNEI
jgi:riboflavin synthase